jgi:hypothetical protein
MILAPGQIFKDYTRNMIRIELAKPQHRQSPPDILERRLWDAAAFDSFIVGRSDKPLRDDLGVPRAEAGAYAAIIVAALKEYRVGRDS